MRILWILVLSVLMIGRVSAQTLYIAAASDLVYCLEVLNMRFKQQYPDAQIKLTTGSSGNFFAQIQQDAPYDVYLSADIRYPQQLIANGFADGDSLWVYARGQIALWTNNSKVDVSQGLLALTQANIKRIAVANPQHAPYGQAAKAALQQTKMWNMLQPKLVLGENIAQTLQFVQTQNADVGIVALSLLRAPQLAGQGQSWLVPLHLYPPLEQAMVVTKRGQKNPLAYYYLQFLKSAMAQKILADYGFLLPAAKVLP